MIILIKGVTMINNKENQTILFSDDEETQAHFQAAITRGYKPYLYLSGYQELVYLIEGFYMRNLVNDNYVYVGRKQGRLYDNNTRDNLFELLISRLPENAKNAILCPPRDSLSLSADKYLRNKVIMLVASYLESNDIDKDRANMRSERFLDEASEYLRIKTHRGRG